MVLCGGGMLIVCFVDEETEVPRWGWLLLKGLDLKHLIALHQGGRFPGVH